jgi:hypothetical protein
MVAAAIDPFLVRRLGFGLGDVVEFTLRAGDTYLSELSPAWPPGETPGADDVDAGEEVDDLVTEAEIAATVRAQAVCLDDIAASCSRPGQAELALQWLSRRQGHLRVSVRPEGLSFGPVLAVVDEHGTVAVPAALLLQTLLAAASRLTALAARDNSSLQALQSFTFYRMEDLLRGSARTEETSVEGPADVAGSGQDVCSGVESREWAGEYPAFVGPGFSGVVTSYLGIRKFWTAISGARQSAPSVIAQAATLAGDLSAGPGVVIYGGLPCLAPAEPGDMPCVHVEELAQMLSEAEGNRDVVAQFLREVALHPGIASLLYVDVMDVWWHWKDNKMIGPLFSQGNAGIAVMPYEGKPGWERAAELEPVEDVLARAGLPECSRWPAVRIDEPGQATMLTLSPSPARAVLVRANPPLVINVSLGDGAPLGFRPDTMYGLGDGIRITAGRHQDIADGLRLPGGRPLTCLVSVTSERQPPEDDGEAVGIAIAIDPERARLGLRFGPEFFDLLADDPLKAHEFAGMAIQHAVAEITGRPSSGGQRFRAAWNAAPPIMMARRFRNTGPASAPTDPIPYGDFARARAYRSIAIAMKSAELPSGPVTERDLIAHPCAVTEALLRQRIGESAPALIADIAQALNAAHAAYWRHVRDLHFSLEAPWAADWQAAALEGDDPAVRIRPLELLLEFLALTPPCGSHRPDRYEVAELAEIARALLEQRTRLNATDVGLSYILEPDPDEEFRPKEIAVAAALGFDLGAYAEARARDRFRIRAPGSADESAAQMAEDCLTASTENVTSQQGRIFSEFEPIGGFDPPAHLLSADVLMREALGTGLDGFRAVLGTAVDWPVDDTGVAVVEAGQLASEAEKWSGLPRGEIEAAVTLLSLDPNHPPSPVHRYWEVERSSFRLRLRPFPVIDSKLWIMPWAAEATQELFLVYLQDFRLPRIHPALQTSPAFQRYRQRQNRQLESETAAIPRDLGLPCRANWTPQDARSAGMDGLPGEVDLIVADAARRRLWICEVKDPEPAFAPAAMNRHIERFTHGTGYVAKLLDKARAIARTPHPAVTVCGVHDGTDWFVIPLMVTRHVEPAAFITDPRVAFTVVEDLAVVLQADQEPACGHVPVGDRGIQ